MKTTGLHEWSKYNCAIGPSPRLRLNDCGLLEKVHHVAHVPDGRRIIDDGKLKARLIFDESILNQTRMHVCWVSPNKWAHGSIYGTVEFTFPWSDLVDGKDIYWVEAVNAYHPPAYRFLLSNRARNDLPPLLPYDPNVDDGPLKRRGADWYWNGQYTAEFMIDSDLPLRLCERLSFVDHNRNICRLDKRTCTEHEQHVNETAALIISYLIGTGNKRVNEALLPDLGLPNGRPSRMALLMGGSQLCLKFSGKKQNFLGPLSDPAVAHHIVRAALTQFSLGDLNEARRLVEVLASADTFEEALLNLIRLHFDLPDFSFD